MDFNLFEYLANVYTFLLEHGNLTLPVCVYVMEGRGMHGGVAVESHIFQLLWATQVVVAIFSSAVPSFLINALNYPREIF